MRIKFLSFIASFFMVSLFITSCLDNDESVEYSTDATIRAFGLDTIGYGINYKFTIDQISGLIYNEDSLPVHADTIIDRILIKTLTTASGIVTMKSKNDEDSIINIADSMDLTKYINAPTEGEYLKLTVWAPDMLTKKTYNVSIRVHQQNPDSLNWGKDPRTTNPFSGSIKQQKLIILNNEMFLFEEGNTAEVYSITIPESSSPTVPGSLNYGKTWARHTLTDMPNNAKLSSLVSFAGTLYIAAADGQVYNSSSDGLTWSKNTNLSMSYVETLITSFSDADGKNNKHIERIAGIIKDTEGIYKFNFTNKEATSWETGLNDAKIVPANFPINNPSVDVHPTESGTLRAVLVGNTNDGLANDTATVVWSSEDGMDWYPMTIESNNNCPKLVDPSIIRYNSTFYITGKDKEEGFQKFYNSPTLLVWKGVNKMFLLPGIVPPVKEAAPSSSEHGFSGELAKYSMIVDKNHFIWMIGSDPIGATWRGRVNKLGFLKQ